MSRINRIQRLGRLCSDWKIFGRTSLFHSLEVQSLLLVSHGWRRWVYWDILELWIVYGQITS